MSEIIVIRNLNLEAHINTLGAEVRKLVNLHTQHNYMWSGDKSIWAGVSPVLFPVVGKTTNSVINYQGKQYPQGNHGFARTNSFTVAEQTESMVKLRLDAQTIATQYPFKLDFEVTYSLVENKLITQYSIHNHEETTAYFSVGAHPAFACPFDEAHTFNDYYIEFEQQEPNLCHHEITLDAFFTGKTTLSNQNRIDLTTETFAKDAIIYSDFQSKSIALKEKNSNRQIKVSLDGFTWLGLWSKINANYVCIEPWCGHSDSINFSGDINQKAAIEAVLANNSWSRSYSIEFAY